jgi:hypothetical protein
LVAEQAKWIGRSSLVPFRPGVLHMLSCSPVLGSWPQRTRRTVLHCDAMGTGRNGTSERRPLPRAAPRRAGEERVAWRPRLRTDRRDGDLARPAPANEAQPHPPRPLGLVFFPDRVFASVSRARRAGGRSPPARDGSVVVGVGRIRQPRARGESSEARTGARAEPRRQAKGVYLLCKYRTVQQISKCLV